jgi:hypothetical protein
MRFSSLRGSPINARRGGRRLGYCVADHERRIEVVTAERLAQQHADAIRLVEIRLIVRTPPANVIANCGIRKSSSASPSLIFWVIEAGSKVIS